jgi:hypothetical protein
LTTFGPPPVKWRKARLCEGGACVEVAALSHDLTKSQDGDGAVVLIRNSEHPAGPILQLPSSVWAEFIVGIKRNGVSRQN